ncbi:uncharacterized protein LOC125030401 [Penaeus chinensis]|uniref:uncharacterized protein LOC125030401 n=1 Tax=Penaeus chinensis TaxID=139456 RepID=UPI001FB6F2F1|nr:uncharacterized protein LOC125030401 [Penaeus chinensis]
MPPQGLIKRETMGLMKITFCSLAIGSIAIICSTWIGSRSLSTESSGFYGTCNRTFYGDVGRSYEVKVEKPKDMGTTFTCHLTFVAEGREFGDIVQLTIQEFSLGDFFSYNSGCPQGWMQISERDRPYTDGCWCGDGRGFNVYYSETATTTLTLKKFIPMDYIHFEGLLKSPFRFRLTYKTLRHSDALLRYGNVTNPKYRGDLVDGTLCDRIFLNCDEYNCAVQSPNFPGLYPRHVTCHYLIRQTRYVPFARPLISIVQEDPLRFNVKDRSALPNQGSSSKGLQIWSACDLVHDHLLVYDGNSTDAPLFLKVCGSGALPPITSTGPDMLLVFSTSRFDEPTQETLMPRTLGFELNVKVNYLSMDSREFARNRQCTFHIFGANNSSGEVTSVVNTQPQNSSCVYLFHGEPHEVVWVHFRKYEIAPRMGHYTGNITECINPLQIYDGNFFDPSTPYGSPRRAKLIQEHCTTRPPPMCAREYLPSRPGLAAPVKACTRNESYVASGPKLTVVQHYNESTAALAMDFILRYEFVNTRPGYQPTNGSECDFEAISDGYSLRTGRVFSPRTSVLYGRWGRKKLSCQYRLTAHSDEVVRVTITKFHSVSRSCVTTTNNFTKGYDCDNLSGQTASLVLSEYPWQDIEVPRLCTCDYSAIPIEYESKSQEVRLKFEVDNMDDNHDYMDFMFEAQYEFIKKSSCKKVQRLQGTNGQIVFERANKTEDKPCDSYPWLLQTSDAEKSIYFRIRGYDHIDKNCSTSTRLLVFKVGRLRPVGVLCPDPTSKNVVELFSFAWQGSGTLVEQSTDKLVLEVSGRDPTRDVGPHTLSWLQVSPARQYDWSAEGIVRGCQQECPELGVCISEDLWCDGIHHCPSGHDELIAHCFFLSVPWAYIGVGSALSILFLVGVTVYGAARLRASDHKTHQHQPIPTLPTASESLFSSDKDAAERDGGVTSAYSLDYSEVDYVTTL